MDTLTYNANEIIHSIGDTINHLEYVVSGKVTIKSGDISVSIKKGGILGLLEHPGDPCTLEYIASENTVLKTFSYSSFEDVSHIIEDKSSDCNEIITAAASLLNAIASRYRALTKNLNKFFDAITDSYNYYKELCGLYHLEVHSFHFLDNIEVFNPEGALPEWINDYYDQIEIMPSDVKESFYAAHTSITLASLWEASSHTKAYLSLYNEANDYTKNTIYKYFHSKNGDLFDLFYNLLLRRNTVSRPSDFENDVSSAVTKLADSFENNVLIDSSMYLEKLKRFSDKSGLTITASESSEDKYEKISNSLDMILRYANMDDAEEDRFRNLISEYKATFDKNSQSQDAIGLREEITKTFFDIYESAIISSFESPKTPIILKMFFNFGYIDENLIGRENALKLYDMATELEKAQCDHVFTMYEWLKRIYHGEIEPSKNDFDQDYASYIKSQLAHGYITEDIAARYLDSNKEKLRFEIRNFFKTGAKITSAQATSFCPILSEHNIIKPLDMILSSYESITENWNRIKSIDYSLFYRECVFKDTAYHINRDIITLEVLPYVILIPTIGSRTALWQETSGVRRDTPARFAIPIFANEDLYNMQLKVAGEYRWEICKKIQGVRWNDITNQSLTSAYFDYLQFYRKNNDLSQDVKDRVKNQILACKSSFKSVFITDYAVWIKFEAGGSPRLNKHVKKILFNYCPLSREYRDNLRNNPMYADLINRHESKQDKNYNTLKLRYDKIKNVDMKPELPEAIINYINYFTL